MNSQIQRGQKKFGKRCLLLLLILHLLPENCQTIMLKSGDIAIASSRHEYEDSGRQEKLQYGKAASFHFQRFQSPETVKMAFNDCRSPQKSFKRHVGKEARIGNVSCTKLGGDWVLAESEQIAVNCTCEEVLSAYLSGDLQQRWNKDKVIDCKITQKANPHSEMKRLWGTKSKKETENPEEDAYYQQDLVLCSQRIIRRHTGVMRYSQRIIVDMIGDENNKYSALIRLLDSEQQSSSTTLCKPFQTLSVYVGLEQKGGDVHVYAAGVMEVNRKVVPDLVIFDASGIAGSMAGKGTLWLAGYFREKLDSSFAQSSPKDARHSSASRPSGAFKSNKEY